MSDKKEIIKIKAVPKPAPEIGIDTDNVLLDNIIQAGESNSIDLSALDSFTNVTQSRENIYQIIDTMSQDSTMSAVLETYAEDTVETNDQGRTVWSESDDPKVSKLTDYFLNMLNVDKNIYGWAHSLIKYGDLYFKLFRQSDYEEDDLFKEVKEKTPLNEKFDSLNDDVFGEQTNLLLEENNKSSTSIKEAINVNLTSKNDHFVYYTEAIPNPGEMFELTRLGKTMGYIQAPTSVQTYDDNSLNSYLRYKIKKEDIDIYPATSFVHACLEDNSSRTPEEVSIFTEDNSKKSKPVVYKVKRGKSLFYNSFRIWRELSLLENSILLNRLTKSSIVRLLQVEVGDMPKDKVKLHLSNIKRLFEQKSSINAGKSMNESTNPGPVENNVIIPIHEGKGLITTSQMGADFDPKKLTDLDWFQNKLFGSLKIPKQYFGLTDDSTGFNGGTSLSIISSRYGKTIKRIQNVLCQALTDIINLYLLDRGLTSYINKFTIRMQTPITQEEVDRRTNNDNRIRYVGDIMDKLSDVPDASAKLEILKLLLASVVNNPEVISIIQKQIDKLEAETPDSTSEPELSKKGEGEEPIPSLELEGEEETPEEETPPEEVPLSKTEEPTGEESYIPSPAELNIDMTQTEKQ